MLLIPQTPPFVPSLWVLEFVWVYPVWRLNPDVRIQLWIDCPISLNTDPLTPGSMHNSQESTIRLIWVAAGFSGLLSHGSHFANLISLADTRFLVYGPWTEMLKTPRAESGSRECSEVGLGSQTHPSYAWSPGLPEGNFLTQKNSRLCNPMGSKDTMWVPPGECHKVKNERSEADYSMRSKCSINNSEYCLHCLWIKYSLLFEYFCQQVRKCGCRGSRGDGLVSKLLAL